VSRSAEAGSGQPALFLPGQREARLALTPIDTQRFAGRIVALVDRRRRAQPAIIPTVA
jgi:hypothetical protein